MHDVFKFLFVRLTDLRCTLTSVGCAVDVFGNLDHMVMLRQLCVIVVVWHLFTDGWQRSVCDKSVQRIRSCSRDV